MPATDAIIGVHLETVLDWIQLSICKVLIAYSLSKVHHVETIVQLKILR